MRAVGLKQLKNKLSEYVRIAASGETILVTDRDRVVAELIPPQAGRSHELKDAMLSEAIQKGWISPPLWPQSNVPPRKPVAKFQALMEELQLDREDS